MSDEPRPSEEPPDPPSNATGEEKAKSGAVVGATGLGCLGYALLPWTILIFIILLFVAVWIVHALFVR